jgi:hypothetical protein
VVSDDDDVPLIKSQMEQEERRIKELQDRMEELAKRVNINFRLPPHLELTSKLERNSSKKPKEDITRSRVIRGTLRHTSFFPSRGEILDHALRTISHTALHR